MESLRITELNIYPVKSCSGISISNMAVTDWGPDLDRRFMVVNDQGEFVTARKNPELLRVKTGLLQHGLLISHGQSSVTIEFDHLKESGGERPNVKVWRDQIPAAEVSDNVSHFFSDILHQSVRLVYMPPASFRQVDRHYFDQPRRVGFADGFPFLVTHESSLDELNQRLDDPVPMSRFRPNIVVAGGAPWAEDDWKELRIGNVRFRAVKPCSRCVMTTIDPQTLSRGKDPLRTLSKYRRTELGVIFGQNLVSFDTGIISVGDVAELLTQSD